MGYGLVELSCSSLKYFIGKVPLDLSLKVPLEDPIDIRRNIGDLFPRSEGSLIKIVNMGFFTMDEFDDPNIPWYKRIYAEQSSCDNYF